jgi:hypothetical protein
MLLDFFIKDIIRKKIGKIIDLTAAAWQTIRKDWFDGALILQGNVELRLSSLGKRSQG